MASSAFSGAESIPAVCNKLGSPENLVNFSKVCEAAERYDDMVVVVKALAAKTSDRPMTVEERNLFSVAFKNVVGALRASWRVLDSVRAGSDLDEAKCADATQAELEVELRDTCRELLGLVDRSSEGMEGKVFFAKMAGDYNRYMAEIQVSKDSGDSKYAEAALDQYTTAYKMAEESLPPTSPIRLGLALNFSVFHYEIRQNPDEACALAKSAFDGAISELDSLSEDEYKDSTLIMQLIRDNLTLWQSDDNAAAPEDDGTAVEDL